MTIYLKAAGLSLHNVRHLSYTLSYMPIDYVQLLRDLVDEREGWSRKRDDSDRELSRFSDLIRSTIKMLSPEQRSKIDCEVLLERIDRRPPGLTTLIRGAFLAGQDWLTPTEIRDHLNSTGFSFERYKANPLASIHTTLKRMIPHEVECKALDGRKKYRLKTAEQWRSAFGDVRQFLGQSDVNLKQNADSIVVLKQRKKSGVA